MTQYRNAKRRLALGLIVLHTAFGPTAQAATTDLANEPLANVTGTASVKPNILFMLDDSGSMMQQYTPDYVSERWGAPALADMHCLNSADSEATSSSSRDLCLVGDPPYMSSQFNLQYYNPAITYDPPVNSAGTAYASQNSANTSGWTAVKTDGFGVQNTNQLESGATTVDLTAQYPERYWCNDTASTWSSTNCRNNAASYIYPDGTFKYNKNGSGNYRYRSTAPYYFNINVGEYCAEESLITCTTVAIGASAPSGYPFPARVRWCNSSANAMAATPATGSCQAKKISPYSYVRFSTSAPANAAYGLLAIGDSGSDNSVSITDVQVNGASVIGSTVTAAGGTNSTSERNAVATSLIAAINASGATHACGADTCRYKACNGSNCPTSGNTVPAASVLVYAWNNTTGNMVTDASHSGFPITVTAPVNTVAASYGVITVTNSGSGSGNVSSITVNGVEVLSGGLSSFGSNSSTNRNNAATAIRNRINAYLNGTPWEYTARVNISGTGCNAANKICVDAPLSAGSTPNGYVINGATSGGAALTFSPMANGNSRFLPTTTTAFNAGSGASSTFERVDIVSTRATYPAAATRRDCATTTGVCSYAEEMTNFANWYAYYRTRMQMMKSSVSHAFLPLTSDYRLAFSTINNSSYSGTSSSRWLAMADLTTTHKANWYTKFFAQSPSGSTPLREALKRAGQLFEGTLSGAPDPVQYSCQQNFTILTTDGYWNGSSPSVGDQDGVEAPAKWCTRANGCLDGNAQSDTLSDVSMYYYSRDLRGSRTTGFIDPVTGSSINNVPTSSKDPNPALHMTTFTLGLGLDGYLTYNSNYETAISGDLYNIRTGATGCAWSGAGTCNWPTAVADTESAVDDLWHAAINGHGTYFSAKNPDTLASSLQGALNGIKVRDAAASASATSTPNVSVADNDIFSATFRTVKWDGEFVAQKIDTTTGTVLAATGWAAKALLDAKVADTADTRTIYTFDTAGGGDKLKSFAWSTLSSTEKGWFDNHCVTTGLTWSQCSTLDATQKGLANNGDNLVNFLRGWQTMEVSGIYRARDAVLGDIASAKPSYVRDPRRNYADTGYSTFKTSNATRRAIVYVAANDGMLHAIDAATGNEDWAYVPRQIMPNLYRLADNNYGTNHQFYVDGSPETGDVFIGGSWRTILVGGLNKGGRGYYALDITDPASPKALWEICSDSSLCGIADADLGYSFGNPVITKLPADGGWGSLGGTWVVLVTSGYNNVSGGDGKGYLFVLNAETGAVLAKIGTGAGNTTTPSGLAKITAWADSALTDNTAIRVYGGDVLGNLWRIDMRTSAVVKLGTVNDNLSVAQPITTRPELGKCGSNAMIFVGTGKYLGTSDLTDTQRQTMYAIKDTGAALGTLRSSGLVQQTLGAASGGYSISSNAVNLSTDNGWFVDFDQNSAERVNLDPSLVLGTLVTVTNQPLNVSSCSTGGKSYMYAFNYCSGHAISTAAGGLAGKLLGTSTAVGYIIVRLPSGSVKIISTFASGEKTTEGVPTAPPDPARRVSWRELTY